jgi:hypothetical protein
MVPWHLPIRHLPRDIYPETFAHTTFAQKDICPDNICPERHLPRKTFAQKDICPEGCLPRRTFAQKDICPERRLPRTTFAQRDICPDNIWLEIHLLRNTIAHTIIDQKYDLPYKEFPSKGPSTRAILPTNHQTIMFTISCQRWIGIEIRIYFFIYFVYKRLWWVYDRD